MTDGKRELSVIRSNLDSLEDILAGYMALGHAVDQIQIEWDEVRGDIQEEYSKLDATIHNAYLIAP